MAKFLKFGFFSLNFLTTSFLSAGAICTPILVILCKPVAPAQRTKLENIMMISRPP